LHPPPPPFLFVTVGEAVGVRVGVAGTQSPLMQTWLLGQSAFVRQRGVGVAVTQ